MKRNSAWLGPYNAQTCTCEMAMGMGMRDRWVCTVNGRDGGRRGDGG